VNTERTAGMGPPMVKIDGDRVRSRRESLGLTQLYVATTVGVTTDTISRWENRRYPTIKQENALKLAETLEVPLADILEQEQGPAREEPAPTATLAEKAAEAEPPLREENPPGKEALRRPSAALRYGLVGLGLLVAMVAGAALWNVFLEDPQLDFRVSRILPRHAAPGQPFPVVIRLDTGDPGPVSLILKEVLPGECTPIDAEPPVTARDSGTGELKWIFQSRAENVCFACMAKCGTEATTGQTLRFRGSVTLRRDHGTVVPVGGPAELEVAPLHWADGNGDGRIDDEEILTVYDNLAPVHGLNYGKEEIEEIWSAGRYEWDAKRRKFLIP